MSLWQGAPTRLRVVRPLWRSLSHASKKKNNNNNLKKKTRKRAAQNSGSESAWRVYICCIINGLFCNRPTDFAETQGPLEAYSPADEIMK